MLRREDSRRRQAWARGYVKAIVQRDVRDIAEVEKLDQLPRLLQTLAHQSGQLTNFTQIGGQIGMDDKTTRKYTGIRLPAPHGLADRLRYPALASPTCH